jgi:tRNA-specific 2-thiouridylase
VIGEHSGLHQFTVGQRRGLGLALGKPIYVVALEPERNRVVVGEEAELYRREASANEINWVSIPPLRETLRCRVKIRHQHEPAPATLLPEAGPGASPGARILFDHPQRAVTPGQAAVFYQEDLLLGGGWIA